MVGTGLKNEMVISELLISGSSALKPRNEFGVYVFSGSVVDDGIVSGQLTKPKYNTTELLKSIDTTIIELLPPPPPPIDDRVARPIYNEATQSVIDLTAQVAVLNTTITDLRAKVEELQVISQSLRIDLDLKAINLAASENQKVQLSSKITTTVTQLQNSVQKATSEAIQRVSLTARNQSLQQELDALRIAATAKEQALAAGAVSTGQLASILFDGGDPSKTKTQGFDIVMDYGGGYASTASGGKFAASNSPWQNNFKKYFEVICSSDLTGATYIDVDVRFKGGMSSSPYDFGFSLPARIQAGKTLRFPIDAPSSYLNGLPGQHGGGLFSHSSPTLYDFTMSIIVTDSSGKSESKDYSMRIYNHN